MNKELVNFEIELRCRESIPKIGGIVWVKYYIEFANFCCQRNKAYYSLRNIIQG